MRVTAWETTIQSGKQPRLHLIPDVGARFPTVATREMVADVRNPGGMGFTVIFLQSMGWVVVMLVKLRLDSFL